MWKRAKKDFIIGKTVEKNPKILSTADIDRGVAVGILVFMDVVTD